MKKMKRFASAALAALMLAGSAPSALALDTTPPMYQQFGYDSAADFEATTHRFYTFDYDTASDRYRQYMEKILANPKIALDYYFIGSMEELQFDIDMRIYDSVEDFYHQAALSMVCDDEFPLREQLTVQLNGCIVKFPDAKPEKVNNRTMVPFRAIAEALGAEVDYNAGAITAKKDGQTLAFSLGGKQLTITDDSTGKVIKTTDVDSAPYKKSGRTYVPIRFFAEGFGLTVQWDNSVQTAVLYDRDALIADIDSRFTVLNQWLKAQPSYGQNAKALQSTVDISAAYTVFNTISGDTTYNASAKINALTDENGIEAMISADLGELPQNFFPRYGYDSSIETAVYAALHDLSAADRKNLQVQLRTTDTYGHFYLHCPALSGVFADWAEFDTKLNDRMTAMKNGAWLKVYTMDTQRGSNDSPERWSELAQGKVHTIGESIVINSEKDAAGTGWSGVYAHALQDRRDLEESAGDTLFTRSGTRYTAAYEANVYQYDDEPKSKVNYTLNTADGSISGTTSITLNESYWEELYETQFSGNLRNLQLTKTRHTRNQDKLTQKIVLTASPSDTAPMTEPSKGSKIVAWEPRPDQIDYSAYE